MRLLTVGIALTMVTATFADTVRLKDGRVIHGTYLGGSARQVRLEVGDQIQTLDVTDVDRIEFGGPNAPAAARCRASRTTAPFCGATTIRRRPRRGRESPGAAAQ